MSESLAVFTQRTLDQFMRLANVPHPTYYRDKFIAFLERYADEHQLSFHRDEYGSVWFDLPATPGFEQHPKVILQAHYDMVCVHTSAHPVDFKEEGIVPVMGATTLTALHTTLGGDDGIGMAIMLALVEADVPHGAVRLLFTADEEGDLDGARELPAEVLDADYLINVDTEDVEQICCACAGYLDFKMTKEYPIAALQTGERAFVLSLDGLKGGHSGDDINKHRLHAISCLVRLVRAVRHAGLQARLASFTAGAAINVITQSGQCVVAVAEAEAERVRQTIAAELDAVQAEYHSETITWGWEMAKATEALSQADSDEWLDLVHAIPQGVLAMSEKLPGLVRKSNNIGVARLEQGKTALSSSSRSSAYQDLLELSALCRRQAEERGFVYEIVAQGPGWDGDPQQPLVQLMRRAFQEATQAEPQILAIHGALECGWFASKRADLQIVSVGPTLHDVHTTGETLILDTLEPTIARILFCLEHIAEI